MSGRRTRGFGLLLAAFAGGVVASPGEDRPSLVFVTLDTTRSDYVGRLEAGKPLTPNLDRLARGGVRFNRALTASPLTLPAHCSLMTGANPPAHGVRDNGASALPADLPTLASALSSKGYTTAAFVASRVLDHRFGLDRGFALYDDAMTAEEVGEQGYPERRAAAVTDAALAWAKGASPSKPFFLWIHYYDAHAPYDPPGDWKGAASERRYGGEIAYVDREVARLLAGLPKPSAGTLVAVVGDHGEMLQEHGEKEHGIFLYRAALEVPLILSGPGVPPGAAIDETVGTRALAATLLRLLRFENEARAFGPGLPGLPSSAREAPAAVYSETWMPATAYGWSPLKAASDGRLRLILAPKPELYDLSADPGETDNLFSQRPEDARRLARSIASAESSPRTAPPPKVSETEAAELAQSLRNLGYLSGSSPRSGSIDPKDGISMLAEFERARDEIRRGRAREAAAKLRDLVRRSPGNVPFLTRLAEAEIAAGETQAGLDTIREAIALNPRLDLLHTSAGNLYAQAGRTREAREEFRAALALNPRSATAWLGLAQIAAREKPAEERPILLEAQEAGTRSGTILARLAQLELSAGDLDAARRHVEESLALLPGLPATWWVAGEVAEKQGRAAAALESYEKAVALGLSDPRAWLRVGKLQLAAGRTADARRSFQRAADLGGRTTTGEDARRLLDETPVSP
jgi:arylsulfatase A-like enzyme/tetratricopeptide (TPR) repeat protein